MRAFLSVFFLGCCHQKMRANHAAIGPEILEYVDIINHGRRMVVLLPFIRAIQCEPLACASSGML